MPVILIVDDTAMDRILVEGLLKREPSITTRSANNGAEAITILQSEAHGIDLVVTDLNMPEIDGLQLTSFIKMACPSVPVVLITAHGSEELAVEALELGAASYVAKKNLADKLGETVRHVLSLTSSHRGIERLSAFNRAADLEFELPNDESLFHHLIEMVRQIGASMGLWSVGDELRLAMALEEALHHAMYRGNLELTSELTDNWRMQSPGTKAVIEQRLADPKFADRRVVVRVGLRPTEARFWIRDQGPGFDVTELPAANDAQAVHDERHRGIVLMRAFMDEVSFNQRGTELYLYKKVSDPVAKMNAPHHAPPAPTNLVASAPT